MSRKPEDYPNAYEQSLDAQAIEHMIRKYKTNMPDLALAQARAALESMLNAIKRGEWLDERDAAVSALTGQTKVALDITPEAAKKLLDDILHTHPQLRDTLVLK